MEKKGRRFMRGEVSMIAMKVGSQWAAYDYRVAQIDQGNGSVIPFMAGNTVMVPVRAVAEGFQGCYESIEGGARVKIDDLELILTNGDKGVSENQGCLFMPLEAMGELFGLDTAYYADTPHAEDVFVVSREDLSLFSGPLAVPVVEILMMRVNNIREYVSMEVPKAFYDLIDLMPAIDLPAEDSRTIANPDYSDKYADLYEVPEEACVREGVPQGRITKYHFEDSKVYPGVKHDCWVYVPSQYDGRTPAKLLILTDGELYLENGIVINVPAILDNMISDGRLPVTIALFVSNGDIGPGNPAYRYGDAWRNGSRSTEQDTVDERYSNFIANEVMPRILAGLSISENNLDRAIVGISSSSPGAFGVAWHHNEAVGTVISLNGSFGNIRGAFVWPYAVRREKRNIRTFLLSSKRDANLVFGNWYLANYAMASGLEYSGYDYVFAVAKAGHSMWPARLLPQILRWCFSGVPFQHEHVELVSGKVDIDT